MEPVDFRIDRLELQAGRLLISAPTLVDPNFARTIVLLLDTDEDGTLGVILNRPSEVAVGEVLESWAEVVGEPDVLFRGGPVGTDSALAVARLAEGSEPVGWRPLFDGTGLIDLDTPREVIVPALHGIRIYAGLSRAIRPLLLDRLRRFFPFRELFGRDRIDFVSFQRL